MKADTVPAVFWKEKFDPLDLYSKSDWKELSHNEKKEDI